MRILLFRVFIAGLVLAGLLSATLFFRSALHRPGTRPAAAMYPFDFDEDRAVDRLSQAIRFRTDASVGSAEGAPGWPAFHAALTDAFPLVHATLRREVVAEGSLLYTWPGEDPELEPVLLLARMDAASVGDETIGGWRYPPYGGVVEENSVWGRGAMDGRGPFVAMLGAVEGLVESEFSPDRTLIIAAVHDGASGDGVGGEAIARLLESRQVRVDWLLAGGGAITAGIAPGVTSPVGVIGIQEQGRMTVQITAHGSGGPASVPSGSTVGGRLSRAVARLEEEAFAPRIEGPTRAFLLGLAPYMDPGTRMLTANLWLFEGPLARALSGHPWFGATLRTTVAPLQMSVEGGPGGLPVQATARVRFGIAPWDSPESVLDRVWELLADLELEVVPETSAGASARPSVPSSTISEAYRLIRETTYAVYTDLLVSLPATVPGATDARYFEGLARNAYRFEPIRLDRAALASLHGANERIRIGDYMNMIRFYAELIRRGIE